MIRRIRSAFTMIDLLVVMAISACLLGLLLPALKQVGGAAARTQSLNNLKQICLATQSHNDAAKLMPPAFGKLNPDKEIPTDLVMSIHVRILPYLEQDKLYQSYLKTEGGEEARNAVVATYVSPQDPTVNKDKEPKGIQNYAASLRAFSEKGYNTPYDKDMKKLGEIEGGKFTLGRSYPDGTAYTIAFATKAFDCSDDGGSKFAAAPNSKHAAFFGQNAATEKANSSGLKVTFQLPPGAKDKWVCNPLTAHAFAKEGILIGLIDGSAHLLKANISAKTWNSALCPKDGWELEGWEEPDKKNN